MPDPHGFHGLGRHDVVTAEELTSVDEYLETVLRGLPQVEPIQLRAEDALGLVLAEPVVGTEPVPPFANSAMDGYAVLSSDVTGATIEAPTELTVAGEALAGSGSLPRVEPGTAVRIMTGAPLPPGATAVVPVENTSEGGGDIVKVHVAHDEGANIRTVGEDVKPGQRLLEEGRRLGPADVGLLSAVGHSRVLCYPKPRVLVVPTGSELVPADEPLTPGKIRDSNGPMIAAMIQQAGGIAQRAEIVPDDRQSLLQVLDSGTGHADLIVCTGGASVGTHDLVSDVLEQLGLVRHHRVAMKPGMPQIFGRIGQIPVFGLPGNPVSAFVSFEVFVRPALRRLQHRSDVVRPSLQAAITEDVRTPANKRLYLRVRLEQAPYGWHATPTGPQGSHVLTSVTEAQGLAVIPEDVDVLEAGTEVTVWLLVESS